MKVGRLNKLTVREYISAIDNHRKYTDFNTLGLYRSVIENEKLSLEEKIEVREHAHRKFKKSFDFLQLKDPNTFYSVSTLGMSLTLADDTQFWRNVIANQEKIIKDKKLNHRSFGVYSKHECGWEDCPYRGLMVKASWFLKYADMHFKSDKASRSKDGEKSKMLKKESRKVKQELKNAFKSFNP
jgi:hypothetical protein